VSIEVAKRIQDEDVAICRSVQRGLNHEPTIRSASVRREAGEHLFHRLLHAISDWARSWRRVVKHDSLLVAAVYPAEAGCE